MSAWLRQHRQAFVAAMARLGMLNAVVIGIALALPAGGYAVLESLHAVAGRFALDTQLSIFLRPELKRAEAETLGKALRGDERLDNVRFIPREQALKDLAAIQGMPEVIAALGHNPLPDAYVVTSKAADVQILAEELEKLPGVAHVQADAVWAHRLATLAEIGRLLVALLGIVLGVGLVAVTFNTIRLQIVTQRDEIEVARLIGATDGFIRRPFYYLGFLLGLSGGVVATAVVAAGLALVNREVGVLAESYGSNFRFSYLSVEEAAVLALGAGALGWLGAHLSVSKHLHQVS